ncbi:MAG: hypothetical protein JJLCMIEE_00823 [Acidimicrobiales bacterium]|nr:hypothetical protein [Acidimicrobiales bacterium]
MCCLVALLLMGAPRIALFLWWLFDDARLQIAFDSFIVPFLGFLFLPFATLLYAIAYDPIEGVTGIGWLLVVLGFLLDLSSWFGGGESARRRQAAAA